MKLFKKHIHVAATLFVAAALVFTTSCTKDCNNPATGNQQKAEVKAVTNKHVQEDIQAAADKMPPIAWYNKTMDKVIIFDPKNETKSFDFSDPNSGWNFSENEGVEFVANPNGGGVLFVSPGAFGSNAGGSGTVVAGNTALNINYTFCFSADEEAIGLDLGLADLDFDGLSMVLGIAGDFEALANEDFENEDVDIFDYFQGLAYYLVYDNEAQGNYEILNFIDDVEGEGEDEDEPDGVGFSVVYGFTSDSFALYFSKDGNLTVSGGSMSFSGNYYGIILDNLFGSDDDEDGDLFNFDFVEVPGFGQMGCN